MHELGAAQDVTEDDAWTYSEFAIVGPSGQRRIRVQKGTQKIEGRQYMLHVMPNSFRLMFVACQGTGGT